MSDKKLSIIIVNYNVKYFVEQCLWSVRAALAGMEAEIFVVDNNSSDGSVAYLEPRFPEVAFIANKDNPGFAVANNQAIRQCTGEYVLLLNPDTLIGEDCLRSLCYFMDEHPQAGGVGVKMMDGHGMFLIESKRSFPSPWNSFCKIFGLSRLFPHSPRYARYNLCYLDENKTHKVEVLAGAFMLLRYEALEKVGLLDEAFFMYGEDIDLSYRICQGGYKNYYIPERILHYKGESTRHNDIKYIKAFYGAMLIFFKKYYPKSGWLSSFFIRLAITGRTSVAACLGLLGRNKKRKGNHRRILIHCHEENFPAIKKACRKRLPPQEYINLLELDET
ncbi:MAG: glycosyltransferase family 2 protein, partial [Tannerellaceae bacterium]|nr:glycosyltransferase family 2 protein [Tannerellaceae bacterium]